MHKNKEAKPKVFGLTGKLMICFLLVALIPLSVFGYVGYLNAVKTLRHQSMSHLVTIAQTKTMQLEDYFRGIEKAIVNLSQNPVVTGAIQQFDGKNENDDFVLEDTLGKILRYYTQEQLKIYDFIFVNRKGDIVFSLMKEDDFGTNLLTGQYKNSQLANVFRQTLSLSETDITPYEYYPPSNQMAAFAGAPIWRQGAILGAVCAQLNANMINELAGNYTGLGKTGEVVIGVRKGSQVEILTPLRHDRDAAFKKKILIGSESALPIQYAVQGMGGIGHSIDYHGEKVIAVWRYLHYPKWGIVLKMDESEVFASIQKYKYGMIFIWFLTILCVVFVAIFISRSITRPIVGLKNITEKIAAGNLSVNFNISARDEIGQLAKSFNTMVKDLCKSQEMIKKQTEELFRSNKELDDFAYIASHDLKEPLRGIHNYATFLIEDYADKLDDEGKTKLLTLTKLSQRLEHYINDLLYYSRLGRTNETYRETDLNQIVEELKDTLQNTLHEQNVTIHMNSTLPTVYCDKLRIRDVFLNLITNAMKYNDNKEKTINIGCYENKSDNKQTIYVRDNGIGIQEKHLETIFRIFKRLHGKDKYGGGTGAGLTIVKKIVENHGGKIWVESSFGSGTTFYFTLGEKIDEKNN